MDSQVEIANASQCRLQLCGDPAQPRRAGQQRLAAVQDHLHAGELMSLRMLGNALRRRAIISSEIAMGRPASSGPRPDRRNNGHRPDRTGCGPSAQTDAAVRPARPCRGLPGQTAELKVTGTWPASGAGTSRRSMSSLSAETSASGTWRRSARTEGYPGLLSSVAIIVGGLSGKSDPGPTWFSGQVCSRRRRRNGSVPGRPA